MNTICDGLVAQGPLNRHETLSIHVTTDRSPRVTGDSIVIMLDRPENDYADTHPASQSWIELSQAVDIPTQMRRGWQQGLRRRRCAV